VGIVEWARQKLGPAPETRATDISALLWSGGAPTEAGEAVGPETAMRCSTVFACVSLIADTVAMLDCHLYRRTADGGRERATDHPAYRLVRERPAPWLSPFDLKRRLQTDLCLRGRAFAFVNRVDGRPVELIPLPHGSIQAQRVDLTAEPTYRLTDGRLLTYRDVIDLTGLSAQHDAPLSPAIVGREAIGLALTMERHAAAIFGKGIKPSGVVKVQGRLQQEALNRLKVSLDQWRRGNAGGTLVLEESMDFASETMTSVDSQFLEMRKLQIAEVARFWRVPLHKIGDLDRSTNNNIEQQGREFLSDCLLPILKQWEQQFTITLLSDAEQADHFFEFLIDDIARADIQARFDAYAAAVGGPFLTADEVRAMENRPAVPGGNRLRVPLNTAPADASTETPT
jgi:HK97 family phage portal protein